MLCHSLHCYAMPKPSAPLLCPNMATLRLALAPRFFSLPARLFSIPHLCPSMPGPFIAIQCLYFTMPVLTSRCSASAIRFLSLPQRNVTYPRLYSAYLRSALALLITALAPLIPASPLLVNAISIPNKAITNLYGTLQSNALTIRFIASAPRIWALP